MLVAFGAQRVKDLFNLKSVLFDLELTKAYSVLSNLNSRREYDKEIGAYFTLRSTKRKAAGEKVLRLTDEMLEIDMSGIREVTCCWCCKLTGPGCCVQFKLLEIQMPFHS